MKQLEIFLGERRKIWLEISSTDDTTFLIRNASYELKKHRTVEDSGECTIDGYQVIALIQPQEKGQYQLIYSYEIGGEILKEDVTINVE